MLVIEIALGVFFAIWAIIVLATAAEYPFLNGASDMIGPIFWLIGVPGLLLWWIF